MPAPAESQIPTQPPGLNTPCSTQATPQSTAAPEETLGVTDLGTMFDTHARDLLRYATQRVGQSHAEDIVAQTFLTAYEQRHRFDASRGELLPWLYGICTNL